MLFSSWKSELSLTPEKRRKQISVTFVDWNTSKNLVYIVFVTKVQFIVCRQ